MVKWEERFIKHFGSYKGRALFVWSACFLSFSPKYVHILVLDFICKYLTCRIYQREVQPFVKDGVGRLPLLLHLAAVTPLLVQRWPLQRRMLGCTHVFRGEGLCSGAVPGLGYVMIGDCLLATGAGFLLDLWKCTYCFLRWW